MRNKIVAGNWKMNKTRTEAEALAQGIVDGLAGKNIPDSVKVLMCPPAPYLWQVQQIANGHPAVFVGGQNCHQASSGAYTGEIAAPMLTALGITYVLVGHSERRAYFGEGHDILKAKVDAVIAEGLQAVFCCGEELAIREAGEQEGVVKTQLTESLFHLSAEQFTQVVIAYEPVWAIGTGKTASPEQAEAMHAFIRQLVKEKYGAEIADQTTILYGGSVKPANAAALFTQPNVDGGLIGGASLKVETFVPVIEEMCRQMA